MKKVLFFAAIASAFAISCTKAENDLMDPSAGRNVIQAVIEDDTRSSVTDGGTFNWTSGDKITLVGADDSNATYNYVSGNNFSLVGSSSVTNPTVAYYPANDNHTANSFRLADSYSYEASISTNAAMIATPPTEGDTYAFRHLGGLMRFNVKNVPVGAKSFSFTAEGKKITGDFTIDDGIIETVASETDKTVTINFTELTAAQDMTFYVPLPVGEYGNYTVAFSIEGQQNKISYPSTNVTNTIARKTLLLMPTFSFNTAGDLIKGNAPAGVIDLEEGDKEADIDDTEGKGAEVVVVPGDDEDDADAVATLNYTPAAGGTSSLSLSDGSADDTVSGESEGNVVVNAAPASGDAATVASLDIDMPTMTVTLQAPAGKTITYNTVTATTAQNTLVIGQGISVGTLNLNGGNVVIEEGASIGTIANNAGFSAMTYIIKKGTLTNDCSLENVVFCDSEEAMNKSMLLSAIANAETGVAVTIKMISDVHLSDETITIKKDQDIILDLNEKKLSATATSAAASKLINVSAGAKLTIKNGNVEYAATTPDTEWGGEGQPAYPGYANNTISNSGTLVVENATLINKTSKGGASYVIDNYAGSVLTVNDGSRIIQEGKDIAIRMFNSSDKSIDVTVNGGEIIGHRSIWVQLAGSNASVAPIMNVNINGGTLTSVDETYKQVIYSYNYGNDPKNVTINISNGIFNGDIALTGGTTKTNVETLNITGGTFNGKYGDVYSYGDDEKAVSAITIKGGNYSNTYPIYYLGENEGNISIKLADDNIIESSLLIPSGNTVALDLNGKTISQEYAQTTTYAMIVNKGNLTINDSSEGNGKISYKDITTYTADVNYASNTIRNEGTLTLNSGTIENVSGNDVQDYGYPHAIDVYQGSTTNIKGGTVKSANYDCIRMFCNSTTLATTVNISGGKIINRVTFQNPSSNQAGYGRLNISGGEFSTTDNVTANVRLLNFSSDASNMKAEISGGTFDKGVKTQSHGSWTPDWTWLTIEEGVEVTQIPIQ